jgi:hypothetical protein
MDRDRIQQWVVASSRARPGNISAQEAKRSTISSAHQPGSAKEAVRNQRKPEKSTVIPEEILVQGQLVWDIGINKIISQAESAFNVARNTCAALIPLEQTEKPPESASLTGLPFRPSTTMLFSQYEKSRRAKRLQASTSDDASGLSTASVLSDIHSVHNSSRVTASSHGVPASSASRHG